MKIITILVFATSLSTILAQKQIPMLPDDLSPSDFGKSKAFVKDEGPTSRIIVLLPDHTYLLFTVDQSPNLKALLEKLPQDTITSKTKLRIIHKSDFISITEKELRKEDFSIYPLSRWDVVQILRDSA